MKIIAVVGRSGSGKTRLIVRLIPELRSRGVSFAVVKHCGHGFDLGGETKDSSQYLAAGAGDVGLVGPDLRALIRRGKPEPSLASLAKAWFPAKELVIIEGGKSEPGLKKIEVLRRGISDGAETPPSELAAIVTEEPLFAGVPVFHPDRPGEIAAWLEGGG